MFSCHPPPSAFSASLIDTALCTLKEKVRAEDEQDMPAPTRVWSTYLTRKSDYLAFRKLQDSTGICRRLLQQLHDKEEEELTERDKKRASEVRATSAEADHTKPLKPKSLRWGSEASLSLPSHRMVSEGACSPARVELLEDGNVQVPLSVAVVCECAHAYYLHFQQLILPGFCGCHVAFLPAATSACRCCRTTTRRPYSPSKVRSCAGPAASCLRSGIYLFPLSVCLCSRSICLARAAAAAAREMRLQHVTAEGPFPRPPPQHPPPPTCASTPTHAISPTHSHPFYTQVWNKPFFRADADTQDMLLHLSAHLKPMVFPAQVFGRKWVKMTEVVRPKIGCK